MTHNSDVSPLKELGTQKRSSSGSLLAHCHLSSLPPIHRAPEIKTFQESHSFLCLWGCTALLDFAVILQLLTVKKYSKIPYI